MYQAQRAKSKSNNHKERSKEIKNRHFPHRNEMWKWMMQWKKILLELSRELGKELMERMEEQDARK
jgi:hypothetical protein